MSVVNTAMRPEHGPVSCVSGAVTLQDLRQPGYLDWKIAVVEETECSSADITPPSSCNTSVIKLQIPFQGNPKSHFSSSNPKAEPLSIDFSKEEAVPKAEVWAKMQEFLRLGTTRAKVNLDTTASRRPISQPGNFSHSYVYPLINRKGKNERIMLSPWATQVQVRDRHGKVQQVVHAASHNYVGFLSSTFESEELHSLCLDRLPITSTSPSALEDAMNEQLATLYGVDFCCTTSTGYGSNLLAFPAILDASWTVILDDKCHNSMHVAAYLSDAGSIRKFSHNDMKQLQEILDETRAQFSNILVAVEGLYSMDGTIPPLSILSTLKEQYNLTLLADEAHSMLSLGKTGRGCVEWWNDTHPQLQVPVDLFDIRTSTLSKSVGALGGVVFGNERFKKAVHQHREKLLQSGIEPLSTPAIVQCLYALNQPTLLRRRIHRLTQVATFVRKELRRAGLYIYGGDTPTAVLPVHTGRPSVAAKMAYTLRKLGVLATPISTPAVPFWQARIRICLGAEHDDETVNKLVRCIVEAAQIVGIISRDDFVPQTFSYRSQSDMEQEALESLRCKEHILGLITKTASASHDALQQPSIIRQGQQARRQYGLACGAARWIAGTSPVHLEVESLTARFLGMPDAMSYADSYIGMISTIAALCRPLFGYKRHTILLPSRTPHSVMDGLKIAPKSGRPHVEHYASADDLANNVRRLLAIKSQITVYITSSLWPSLSHKLSNLLKQYPRAASGLTLLIHNDTSTMTRITELPCRKDTGAHVLVYGSFHQAFGLSGAYLAGETVLLDELRYTSRGYMFTSSQMPCIMAMIAAGLKEALEKREY